MPPRYCFEDFEPGSTMEYGDEIVSKEDIVVFAREFDPQPFHLDEEAARASFAGGLIASGWHTCALLMSMIARGFLLESTSMGAPGIEEVRWLRPVRPGDRLSARHTVLEARASRSRPDRGLIRFNMEVLNQEGGIVQQQTNWIMLARRGHADATEGAAHPPRPAPAEHSSRAVPEAQPLPFFDDLVIGERADLGAFVFTSPDIIRYASRYDPQAFHVDPQAAARSHFGGLCASGWHTGAVWMKQMIAHRERARDAAEALGRPHPQLGPSPGFKNLKWLKPVYAGDEIRFASTIIDKRVSRSRPGWGLAFHHNTGENQHGEAVLEFDGCVFWQRAVD